MEKDNMLFEAMDIHGMQLKNRVVKSATYEGMATEDGYVTDQLVNFYTPIAEGGSGLVILGYAYVQENGHCLPFQTGIAHDEHIPGLKRVVDAIHQRGAKVAVQIAHAGRQTMPVLIGGQTPMAPSAIEADPMFQTAPREMTEAEIHETIDAFAAAAGRGKQAGGDAVQLHAANGYLLAQFLSPHTNRRTDEWGGSSEKRMRFVLEVYDNVRQAVGSDYPVLIKLSVEEGLEDGMAIDEACKVAEKLAQRGIDSIEINGGTVVDTVFLLCRGDIPIDILTRGKDPEVKTLMESALYSIKDLVKFEEACWLPQAERIKAVIGDVPLILGSSMKYPQTMEQIVSKQQADLISLARPLIREPNFPKEMAAGRKDPAKCAFCNRCLAEAVSPKPLKCYNLR